MSIPFDIVIKINSTNILLPPIIKINDITYKVNE
jgi:hypothetical protein